MQNKMKQNIKDRIDAMTDTDQLQQALNQLGLEFEESVFAAEMVWAVIKSSVDVGHLQDDPQRHLLESKHTQDFANDTKGVKLFFDGDWYINNNFNLKLRPEWIEIIGE